MDHNFIRHKLSEYIDGTVGASERAEIETHLKTCGECSDALSELKKTIEHVKSIDEIEPPAWMTQKIMAKVRAEAGQRKSISQRLYSAFVVNLPVKAVAVVFLAAIAFYMYRDIGPQKLSEEPIPQAAVKKEAPASGIADSGLSRSREPLPRASQVPQKPGYKALDMKPEYEKPAPPILERKAAAPAPAESSQKKDFLETRPVAPQAAVPMMKQEQTAPSAGSAATADEKSAASSRMMKAKASGEARADKIVLTLSVQHGTDSVREVEKIIEKLGGKVIKKEAAANTNALTLTLDSTEIGKFTDQLRAVGTLKEKDLGVARHSGTVTIELLIASTVPQAN